MFEMLVEKGGVVLPALKRYMLAADSISWPLRLLDKIVDTEGQGKRIDVIAEVLERHEPGYERDPTKKIQLLNHLARAQARARAGAGRALSDRHGRRRALRGGRGAAAAGRRGAGAHAAARPVRPRKRACACACDRRRLRRAGLAGARIAAPTSRSCCPTASPSTRRTRAPPRRASRRNPERRSNHSRAQTRRHQDGHAHRLGADRHRPGLRVRLLGHPGRARRSREEGYRVVLVNSNPATIMTDPELADATYVEPLTVEVLDQHHRAREARRAPADAGRADRR